jgi:MYXO-CTERM domain-containing protein
VVLSLTFTDDTGGVFIDHGVATPEVTTLGTLAVGAAGLLGRRRRRRV